MSIQLDATAPSSTASCNAAACSAATTYAAPLTVTLAGTDAGSGVAQVRYTTDGTTPSDTTGTVYDGPIALSADTTLTYRAFDVAGNAEAANTIALHVSSTPVGRDAADDDGDVHGRRLRRLARRAGRRSRSLRPTTSRVRSSTRYTTNGTDPTPTTGTVYTAPFTLAATTALRFRSFDAAGNAEAVQSVSVRIDATAPDGLRHVQRRSVHDGLVAGARSTSP